jgi:anti-sigma factor RsiW
VDARWSDEDVGRAEAYLDGALEPAEAEELTRRLAAEVELVSLLEMLRAQRADRAAVWAAGEPPAAEAEALATRTVAALVGAERWRKTVQTARRATAVAALVMVAFAAGWTVRGRVQSGVAQSHAAESRPWAYGGGSSFPVALTDERGNVVAVQHFDDPTQARQFADDVGRWQSKPRRRTQETELVIPVSSEF